MLKIAAVCLVFIVLAAVITCVLIAGIQSKHSFKCRNCGKEFQPKWTQMIFEIHVLDEHKIKCPFCNIKDFCQDKGKTNLT